MGLIVLLMVEKSHAHPCPISPSHPIGREVATEKRNLDPLAGRLVAFLYDKP
jgi:hypothetical protein